MEAWNISLICIPIETLQKLNIKSMTELDEKIESGEISFGPITPL